MAWCGQFRYGRKLHQLHSAHYLAYSIALSTQCLADPTLPGGSASVGNLDHNPFGQPSANMPSNRQLEFSVGRSFFRNPWVPAPSSTDARDGLGPLFNTNACQNCHTRKGRGSVPLPGEDPVALLVRISTPSSIANPAPSSVRLGVEPEPTYGTQLHNFAIPGVAAEASLRISYQETIYYYPDGTTAALRKPVLAISALAYGPLHPQTLFSLRLAPSMIGLGLLAAVPEAVLMALEDPQDTNRDGISGHRNRVWDSKTLTLVSGRFGWKAGQPNLAQQNASAFANDLGISSALQSPGCPDTALAETCRAAPPGGEPELAPLLAERVNFYTANLAVPKTRPIGAADAAAGAALFSQLRCAGCHQPVLTTGGVNDMPWLSKQTIHPYTDLLLHDLGEGLADHRTEFAASGSEWRTAPLWGIGLAQEVNPTAGFLHDGRARTLEEAILWHDGEAAASRIGFSQLSAQQRALLLRFINHL